jgi:hypothetical protein
MTVVAAWVGLLCLAGPLIAFETVGRKGGRKVRERRREEKRL